MFALTKSSGLLPNALRPMVTRRENHLYGNPASRAGCRALHRSRVLQPGQKPRLMWDALGEGEAPRGVGEARPQNAACFLYRSGVRPTSVRKRFLQPARSARQGVQDETQPERRRNTSRIRAHRGAVPDMQATTGHEEWNYVSHPRVVSGSRSWNRQITRTVVQQLQPSAGDDERQPPLVAQSCRLPRSTYSYNLAMRSALPYLCSPGRGFVPVTPGYPLRA